MSRWACFVIQGAFEGVPQAQVHLIPSFLSVKFDFPHRGNNLLTLACNGRESGNTRVSACHRGRGIASALALGSRFYAEIDMGPGILVKRSRYTRGARVHFAFTDTTEEQFLACRNTHLMYFKAFASAAKNAHKTYQF